MHTEEEVSNKPAEERVIEKEIEQNANQEIIDIQAEEVLPEEGYEQEIIIPDKEQGPGF